MADFFAPKKGVAFSFVASVGSQATSGTFQIDPTIAAGDFKISKDGGALANLTNLPAVSPAGSSLISFALTLTEMNADNVTIQGKDAAGAEWFDVTISIQTSTNATADLALQTTAAATKTKTDFLPSATAGAAGGVAIAGANAATSFASGSHFIGTLDLVTANSDMRGTDNAALASLWTSTIAGRIDAAITSRMASYTQPTGFLAANFALLDAAISSRSTYAGGDTSGVTTLLARLSATRAGLLDNLSALDAAISAVLAAVAAGALRSALGLGSANLDTQLDALPTNAELATSQAAADDATLAAIAALSIPSLASISAQIITDHGSGSYIRNTEPTTPPTVNAIAAAVRDVSNASPAAGSLGEAVNNADDGSAPTAAAIADAVWDEAAADHVAALTTGAALTAINGKTQAISNGVFTLVSPIATSGTITLFRGDDYFNADGAALTFTSSTFPTLTAATILLKISNGTNFTGVVTSATSVYFEITRAQTAALTSPEYHYEVEATLADGHVRTIATGALHMDD